ncbi:unnamed protein product [Medioppia subpectinata]|uniref:EF-hand domain-containing protein n=1 Tax=Medioppia subpectinata TaxID=1979941 RepID=A0A7R9KGD6_9ACAR|nr:unnamed protein product [Medioppia subpectinata]CAG2102780.1 unnamed protein product [Medioppia subpectinata]
MNSALTLATLLAAIVLMINVDKSAAECCYAPLSCPDQGRTCYDCTGADIYCGVGKCNAVGCNCDGGCRAGHSGMWCWNIASGCKDNGLPTTNALTVNNVTQVFARLDADRDGRASYVETLSYVSTEGLAANKDMKYEFYLMDKNHDGFLTINEIDA